MLGIAVVGQMTILLLKATSFQDMRAQLGPGRVSRCQPGWWYSRGLQAVAEFL